MKKFPLQFSHRTLIVCDMIENKIIDFVGLHEILGDLIYLKTKFEPERCEQIKYLRELQQKLGNQQRFKFLMLPLVSNDMIVSAVLTDLQKYNERLD